jgi:outer membrane protein OmpA-like peptidoglycan-associated protein
MYVGFVAKKRVSAVQQAYKHDDLAGMIAAATGQENKPVPLPKWKPASADIVSSPASKIPLRRTLSTINTGSDPLRGDYESIFIVDNVTDQFVHIKASQQFPNGDMLDRLLGKKTDDKEKARTIKCGRTVFREDLETANDADAYFCREGQDEKHHGTTAMALSRKNFNELKTTGQAEIVFHEDPLRAALKSFKNAMNAGDDKASEAASQDFVNKMMKLAPAGVMTPTDMDTPPIKYNVHRQGNSDLAFPVLVNDQPTELPVMDIFYKRPDGLEGHVYILDDADNPLFLAGASEQLGREQVTKISWQLDTPKSLIAEELEKTGRAKVYDLYFDFRSDQLRPESDKVLKEIAAVMREHPDWKLSIEGNTDNIGGEAYNLDLSKRRAAAVKAALVADYNIASDHLSTTGFGLSHPIDTNDTMEGRARNRRVEIAKQ